MQANLLAYLEAVVVWGLGTMVLDVFRNHLIGYVPTRCYKIPAGPKVPAPERRPQSSAIHQQVMQSRPLDGLHHFARGQVRRHAQQQMHVVGSNVPAHYGDLVTTTISAGSGL